MTETEIKAKFDHFRVLSQKKDKDKTDEDEVKSMISAIDILEDFLITIKNIDQTLAVIYQEVVEIKRK